ncbi:MAG: hypothetical protein AAB263_18305, partial [Planctomycetota bacterium]
MGRGWRATGAFLNQNVWQSPFGQLGLRTATGALVGQVGEGTYDYYWNNEAKRDWTTLAFGTLNLTGLGLGAGAGVLSSVPTLWRAGLGDGIRWGYLAQRGLLTEARAAQLYDSIWATAARPTGSQWLIHQGMTLGRWGGSAHTGLASAGRFAARAGYKAITSPEGFIPIGTTATAAIGTVAYNLSTGREWTQDLTRNSLLGLAAGVGLSSGYAGVTMKTVARAPWVNAFARPALGAVSGASLMSTGQIVSNLWTQQAWDRNLWPMATLGASLGFGALAPFGMRQFSATEWAKTQVGWTQLAVRPLALTMTAASLGSATQLIANRITMSDEQFKHSWSDNVAASAALAGTMTLGGSLFAGARQFGRTSPWVIGSSTPGTIPHTAWAKFGTQPLLTAMSVSALASSAQIAYNRWMAPTGTPWHKDIERAAAIGAGSGFVARFSFAHPTITRTAFTGAGIGAAQGATAAWLSFDPSMDFSSRAKRVASAMAGGAAAGFAIGAVAGGVGLGVGGLRNQLTKTEFWRQLSSPLKPADTQAMAFMKQFAQPASSTGGHFLGRYPAIAMYGLFLLPDSVREQVGAVVHGVTAPWRWAAEGVFGGLMYGTGTLTSLLGGSDQFSRGLTERGRLMFLGRHATRPDDQQAAQEFDRLKPTWGSLESLVKELKVKATNTWEDDKL